MIIKLYTKLPNVMEQKLPWSDVRVSCRLYLLPLFHSCQEILYLHFVYSAQHTWLVQLWFANCKSGIVEYQIVTWQIAESGIVGHANAKFQIANGIWNCKNSESHPAIYEMRNGESWVVINMSQKIKMHFDYINSKLWIVVSDSSNRIVNRPSVFCAAQVVIWDLE